MNGERYSDGTPKLRPQFCIECGLPFNAISGTKGDNAIPQPGNISLCLNCGHLTVFSDNGMLREPLVEEWDDEMREIERRGRAAATHFYTHGHSNVREGHA